MVITGHIIGREFASPEFRHENEDTIFLVVRSVYEEVSFQLGCARLNKHSAARRHVFGRTGVCPG